MSAQLSLAKPPDLDRILPLVAAFHSEHGIEMRDEARHNAILPLLEGSPLGAIYIIGPGRAPIGYIVLTFTWSVEFGGIEAAIDEMYLRPAIRGRGIASEALGALIPPLRQVGVRAVSLEVDPEDAATLRMYTRALFKPRKRYQGLTRIL